MNVNQYQDIINTNFNRTFIADYLVGDIYEVNNGEKLFEVFDNKAADLAHEYELELKKIKSKQMTVVLIPTYGCNLKCKYCYEGSITYTNNYSKLNIKDVINAIIKLKKIFNYSNIQFILLGGEPISKANLKWFSKFFLQFQKTNIPYIVNCISNGVNVFDNINEISQIQISNIQITLDGLEEQQNQRRPTKDPHINVFKSIVEGIDLLLTNNINVNVRINVDTNNICELPKMHHFFHKKNWWSNPYFSAYIYPISFNGNDKNAVYPSESEMLKKVTNELLKIEENYFFLDFHGLDFVNEMLLGNIFYPNLTFCEATTNQYVFDDTGKVYTCWWGTSIDNFTLSSIKDIGSETFNKNIAKWHNRNVTLINECISCKYKFLCGGGCSFKAHINKGSFKKGNCAPFRENIKIFLEYLIENNKL